MYHSIFEPKNYGFNSIMELFKSLDQIVEIRNNVLYQKNNISGYVKLQKFHELSNKKIADIQV